MNIAIFIDGPLAQEVRNLCGLPDTFRTVIPKRTTVCWCDPDDQRLVDSGAEIFTYYRVMKGDGIGLYSKSDKPTDVVRAVKEWVVTDLSNVDKLYYSCRDRRAFA